MDRINGAHVPELTKKTAIHSDLVAPPPVPQTTPTEDLHEKLKRLTTSAKCVLFMKGTPQEPRCGQLYVQPVLEPHWARFLENHWARFLENHRAGSWRTTGPVPGEPLGPVPGEPLGPVPGEAIRPF